MEEKLFHRRLAPARVLLFGLGLLTTGPAPAAILRVTSLADPAEPGKCTLRDAIAAANTNDPAGGCPAGGPGPDRIEFDVSGVIQLTAGPLLVRESLDIEGPGADALEIRGPGGDVRPGWGLFELVARSYSPSASFRIHGLTLAGASGSTGGAIFAYSLNPGCGRSQDVLVVDACHLRDNITTHGSAISAVAIGRLEIVDTTITGASPGVESVLSFWEVEVALVNTTIATSGAQESIEIGVNSGELGCLSEAQRHRLALLPTSVAITGCTLAGSDGIGVYLHPSSFVVLTLRGTVLSGHVAGNVVATGGATVRSLGDNISSDGTGVDLARHDDLGRTDPRLGPLSYDGGPVPTLLPLPGSPAIDRVPLDRCSTATDARGAPRPLDGDGDGTAACDAGAAEAPGPPLPESITLVADAETCDAGAPCSVTARLTDALGKPLQGRRLTFVVTGAHPSTGAAASDATGRAVFSYTARTAGVDSLHAVGMDANGAPHRSETVVLAWRSPAADLSVGLALAPARVAPGGRLVHTMRLRNDGPSAATDPVLTLSLPAGLEVLSWRGAEGWSCVPGATLLRCEGTRLAASGSASFEVVSGLAPSVAAGTVLTFAATVAAATPDTVPANDVASTSATVTAAAPTASRLVPIVLDATSGAARFTTELSLTNRGASDVALTLTYTPSLGSARGAGSVTLPLPAGRQLVVPDVLASLRDHGLPLPPPSVTDPQGGTLLARFDGASEPDAIAASARTTTPTSAPQPAGSVGVAYPGIDPADGFPGVAYVFGLRESDADRSNLAVLNPGSVPVTVRVTAVSGDDEGRSRVVREALALAPLAWTQVNRVLGEAGFSNGYVRIERISANGSFQTYGVVNANGTDDGSFVPAASGTRTTQVLTVPVVAEFPESRLVSELVLANKGTVPATLRLTYVESLNPGLGPGGTVLITLGPGEQRLLPSALDLLRAAGAAVGKKGVAGYAGALRIDIAGADPSDVFAGARTVTSTVSGGPFGLFAPAIPGDATASSDAFVLGLQATGTTRSNVALSNAGTSADGDVELEVQAFDGDADGIARGAARKVRLGPGIWEQIDGPLKDAGIANGWVRIRRLSGTAPWIAYGVLNDGGAPGERSGDGAYLEMAIPR